MGVLILKIKFKNIFLLLSILIFSFMVTLKTNAFKIYDTVNMSNFALESLSESSENKEGSEDSDVFGFIKDNKNVKDFFYDGSALLYGGILLISISVFGIYKTLKPKRKRSRYRSKNKRKTNRR